MEGLSRDTASVFERIKDLDILSEYVLMGGSALSMQIRHRLSVDLDFCKWQDQPDLKNAEIQWPLIEAAFRLIGEVRTDILDLHQVDFFVDTGAIRIASLRSLGATKIEVMSRRNLFRDYYDVYSILKEGSSLKDMVDMCGRYSRHRMRSKMILSMLSNGSLFKYESSFEMLEPKYHVNSEDIEAFIQVRILEEYGKSYKHH